MKRIVLVASIFALAACGAKKEEAPATETAAPATPAVTDSAAPATTDSAAPAPAPAK